LFIVSTSLHLIEHRHLRQSVHKALETEIRGEELRVHVTDDEERWALRCEIHAPTPVNFID
jgi:hypothetical protein